MSLRVYLGVGVWNLLGVVDVFERQYEPLNVHGASLARPQFTELTQSS